MAEQVALALGSPVGTAIDVWSLGCMLAELALQQPLFPCHSPAQLLKQVLCLLPTVSFFLFPEFNLAIRAGRSMLLPSHLITFWSKDTMSCHILLLSGNCKNIRHGNYPGHICHIAFRSPDHSCLSYLITILGKFRNKPEPTCDIMHALQAQIEQLLGPLPPQFQRSMCRRGSCAPAGSSAPAKPAAAEASRAGQPALPWLGRTGKSAKSGAAVVVTGNGRSFRPAEMPKQIWHESLSPLGQELAKVGAFLLTHQKVCMQQHLCVFLLLTMRFTKVDCSPIPWQSYWLIVSATEDSNKSLYECPRIGKALRICTAGTISKRPFCLFPRQGLLLCNLRHDGVAQCLAGGSRTGGSGVRHAATGPHTAADGGCCAAAPLLRCSLAHARRHAGDSRLFFCNCKEHLASEVVCMNIFGIDWS